MLENYLDKNNLTNLYEQTKDIFKNFWTIVPKDEVFYQFIQIDVMKLLDPAPSLEKSLTILATIPDIVTKLKNYPNVGYAFLNSDQSSQVFLYSSLLPLLNSIDTVILKLCLFPDGFFKKLDDALVGNRIKDSYIIRMLQNIYIPTSESICKKFIIFLNKLTPVEFVRHIVFYTRNDGFFLHVIEKNFDQPEDYYLRFTAHYAINLDIDNGAEFLFDSFYKNEWKQTVIPNFFNAFNEDTLAALDLLKLIEFNHPLYCESLILGLLNLLFVDNVSGYKRLKFLLSIFIKDGEFSLFLNQLTNFAQNEVNFILMKLSQNMTEPEKFLQLPESTSIAVLKTMNDPKENLFWLLEKNDAFTCFFSPNGDIYIDLIDEMKVAPQDNIQAWLGILGQNPGLLLDLQFFSRTNKKKVGFPNVIAGVLCIGDYEEASIIPNPVNAQIFLSFIVNNLNGVKTPRSICFAIESLDSKIKSKKLITFIKDKPVLINNISFEDDLENGIEKSKAIIQCLCISESKMLRKVGRYFLNQSDISPLLNSLFYKDEKGEYQVTTGFLQAIDQNSSSDNIMTDIQSFTLKNSKDAFAFVRSLERISGPDVAFEKFDQWIKVPEQEREDLIAKMGSFTGDQLSNFIMNYAGESQVGDLLGSLSEIKGKSGKLYDGLMTIFSKIPSQQFQELEPMIEHKVSLITKDSDILQVLNSSYIDYDKAKIFLTNLTPNLIEAIHEAFLGDVDVERTLRFILALLDKDFVIEALNGVTVIEAKLLIQAFTSNNLFLKKTLYVINDFGYEGGAKKIRSIFKELLWIEDLPEQKRVGVSPIPIKACINFIDMSSDLNDKHIWQQLAYTGLIRSFEKVLTSVQNKKIAHTLLRDRTFMFVLSCVEEKENLIQHLISIYQSSDSMIYLNPIYTAHLILFDALDESRAKEVFEKLDYDISLRGFLEQYINPHIDPSNRLLCCALKALYGDGYKSMEMFSKLLNNNPGMMEALSRLYNWNKNTAQDLMTLMGFMKRRFINGRDKFKFPSHQNTVIQDDYLYQWLEASKRAAQI